MVLKTEAAESVKLTAQIAYTGTKHINGVVMEEYDPDLRGLRGVRVYEEMRLSDPIVATGLRAIRWVLGQVGWHVESEDEGAKAFVESCLEDMSHTWSQLIQNCLAMLAFGWAYFEVVYKLRQGRDADPASRYDDGKIGWRKLALVRHETLYRWMFDPVGSLQGLEQWTGLMGQVVEGQQRRIIPIEKSVLFTMDKEGMNPEGTSLLRPVYLPWYKKRNIEEIEVIGIERDLTGVPVITMPIGATETDRDNSIDLLEQWKLDDMSGFVFPRQGAGDENRFILEVVNSPGSKAIDIDKTILRYQMEIMRAFLAQFLMLGQGGRGGGSWALSRDQRGMFELALGAIVLNIEETINRFLLPPLFRFNDFGQLDELPKIKAGRVGKADLERFGDMIKNLVDAGVLTPDSELEKFVRNEMELPEKPEEELIEKPAVPPPAPEPGEQPEEIPTNPPPPSQQPGQTATEEFSELSQDELTEFGEVDWASDKPSLSWIRNFARPKTTPLEILNRQIDKGAETMANLAADFKAGNISGSMFITKFQATLSDAERKALVIGQKRLTPDTNAISRGNRAIASAHHNEQLSHFKDMIKDLPKISEAQLAERGKMYVRSSEGLYHQVVRAGQPPDTKVTWHLSTAVHCEDCLDRDSKTWKASELPWVPGDGNSICLTNCRCWLEYQKG